MTIQLPVVLPNIDEIEEAFKASLGLYTEAFDAIEAAEQAIRAAQRKIETMTPGARFHSVHDFSEIKEFNEAVKMPERAAYLSTARKLLTLRCWHYVIDRCGMQQLMDAQAKKEFDAQLKYVSDRPTRYGEVITSAEAAKGPPEFTAENVRATMDRFSCEAGLIWRRGIANAFSKLERRFKSHDGFKVGSRMILTYFTDSYGSVELYGNTAETFRDIERTFMILDGRDPRQARSDFLYTVDQERRDKRKPCQSEHENEYFKVRVFKNGNAHLWFARDDLVELVNKELAAYYGEVIGDGQTQEADPLESRAIAPARLFGFYPTPNALAEKIIERIPWSDAPQRILEPSAGTGNLAFLAAAPRTEEGKTFSHRVDAIEIQPKLAEALRLSGKLNRVTTADFLSVDPGSVPAYDGVLMNPPFDRERDIDHVSHALKFLKPDGWLLSIMSAGVEFRETRKAAAFRKLLDQRKGWMIDLPGGSFAETGTCVNTVLIGIGAGSKPWLHW